MDTARHEQQAKLEASHSRAKLHFCRELQRAWSFKHNFNRQKGDNKKHHRHYKYFPALIALLASGSPALADSVGGVSATANPIAQSSSSVQNQAVQILQGPYIQSAIGSTSCMGPTFNLTPFATNSTSYQQPYEATYFEPVYDTLDLEGAFDEDGNPIPDGVPDNGWGAIAYQKPVRTGQKNNFNWSLGLSATISIPLDGGIQERCKASMSLQNRLAEQALLNKQLDYSIARLRHCGELAQQGISFASWSPAYKVCADVVVAPKMVQMAPHVHEIEITPSDLGLDGALDSSNAEQGDVGGLSEQGFASP